MYALCPAHECAEDDYTPTELIAPVLTGDGDASSAALI